jgi:hypothetical protein
MEWIASLDPRGDWLETVSQAGSPSDSAQSFELTGSAPVLAKVTGSAGAFNFPVDRRHVVNDGIQHGAGVAVERELSPVCLTVWVGD